ncbi:MAG: hypothetical protein P3W91_002925 [Fervidobacterium sp.]|nr:hypothetical protein [Fervidobacterium sp.]
MIYQAEDEVDVNEVIKELKQIHLRLSSLIDHYWMFGREFVRPIAELRSKVSSYEIYFKQMR